MKMVIQNLERFVRDERTDRPDRSELLALTRESELIDGFSLEWALDGMRSKEEFRL